jgi:uncharacterized protein YjeT (DUF2065 family)
MQWTRASLFYLAGYLLLTGISFLVAPHLSLSLLGSQTTHEAPLVRFIGGFMVALGTVVSQIIRHRVEVLYRTTAAVRVFFLVLITGLYSESRDPMCLSILLVVGLGFSLTVTGLFLDRGAS